MAYLVTNPELKQVVYDVLVAGFTVLSPLDLTGNPDPITGKPTQPIVKFGVNDPMDFADFPFVGINLLSDSESFQSIGDSIQDELVGFEEEVYAGASTLFQQHVEVKLWCRNGDERDRLGSLVKQALFSGRGTDVNPGLFNTTDGLSLAKITGGVDEGISVTSEGFSAHTVYSRTYFVTAVTELTLQEAASEALKFVIARGDIFQFNETVTLGG